MTRRLGWRTHLRVGRVVLFLWIWRPWNRDSKPERSTGASLAIPSRGEWLRLSVALIASTDDGCARMTLEAVAWRARKQKAPYRIRRGRGGTAMRSYVANTKRYARVMVRVRYRGRRAAAIEAAGRRPENARP